MNPNMTVYDHEAIHAYYADGHSITECRQEFQCSYRTVKRAVLKFGKLRSISEGVTLRNSVVPRPHATLASRQKMSLRRRERAIRPLPINYRTKRSNAMHPELGLTEKAWFRYLLSKNNYTCAVTGERGCRLSVHHLYSVCSRPELRWDESNVVVVREDIHKKFHIEHMGGFSVPCRPDDFKEFLATRVVPAARNTIGM